MKSQSVRTRRGSLCYWPTSLSWCTWSSRFAGPAIPNTEIWTSSDFANVCDQVPNAVGQLHNFSFSLNIEINFIIAGRCVINRFPETDQRLHHLAWQNKADPYAYQERNHRNDGQRPFGSRNQALRLAVIAFDASPVSRLQLRSQVQNVLPGILQVHRNLPKRRTYLLNRLGNLCVKGVHAIAQLVDQLRAPFIARAL